MVLHGSALRSVSLEDTRPKLTLRGVFDADNRRIVFRRLIALAAFVFVIWAVQVLNWAVGYDLNPQFGLIPRRMVGLDGIIGLPLLHGSYAHLISNTPPLLLMGALLALTATRALIAVNGFIVVIGGSLVWLLGSSAIHIGASGLVFGWFGFLVTRGFVDRSPITLAAALIVGLVYGSIVWGVLPGQPGISWEAHLFGALAGAGAALIIPTNVHAPRLRNVDRR